MVDDSLIVTLEQTLRQTRNAQNRLAGRLREAEMEVEQLRMEIAALENSAAQTERAIHSLLVSLRTGGPLDSSGSPSGRVIEMDGGDHGGLVMRFNRDESSYTPRSDNTVSYLSNNRPIPSISPNSAPVSNRFADLTITQACKLLLREAGGPLHVNELYNLLIAGGMRFKGNNPTISIAVSLNRNRQFRKVDPGTFDLVMRDVVQIAS
ncbi:MAG: hypothetical protein IPM50_02190 [Acidobacteriota bacterium]|nr:MAG: hypothetical protein IPM50_02190 [Acidobacteriota bacterium]